MTNSTFLKAFKGENEQVPVWFMRQAGRYLPEYQAIRKEHALDEMFETPSIASEITCQPISILGVDAAILFADILTLPKAMGVDIHFDNTRGPVIDTNSVAAVSDISRLEHVSETIRIVKEMLPEDIPLIGFSGSPFTVLTYLVEGGSSTNFRKTLRFMNADRELYHVLMDKLTANTISYFHIQKEAGIDAFQVFDTWAGILDSKTYVSLVLPYLKRIFKEIAAPSIYYARGSGHLVEHMDELDCDFLSLCHTSTIGSKTLLSATQKGIQGNLYNGTLYRSEDEIVAEVNSILNRARRHSKYIFNLNHGILPDMQASKLKKVVETVHAFKWTQQKHDQLL